MASCLPLTLANIHMDTINTFSNSIIPSSQPPTFKDTPLFNSTPLSTPSNSNSFDQTSSLNFPGSQFNANDNCYPGILNTLPLGLSSKIPENKSPTIQVPLNDTKDTDLSSLTLPNIAINIPISTHHTSEPKEPSSTSGGPEKSKSMVDIYSNSLNGQLEINKQLMTCLSVALEEIKELRKQLAQKDQEQISIPSPVQLHIPNIPLPDVSMNLDKSNNVVDSGLSTPSSMSPFHTIDQQGSPFSQSSPSNKPSMITSILQQHDNEWLNMTGPKIDISSFRSPTGKRMKGEPKLKSNVPAACRSIVKNVYRELARRSAINAFDLHQGQESAHNVKIYWQVIEYIKKTNESCIWEEADMLYAIRTYWRSLRDDRQRELSGKKYNHRRMIIRREIMKRKLKSRQKAVALVSWSPDMKQNFEETLTLDYMSSEEEDNTVVQRDGPRPRVVRRIPWESETMSKCKAELDLEFRKICSARQLKATAHVYRRPAVISSRTRPVTCPQWATNPAWVPEILTKSDKIEIERPSMIQVSKDPNPHASAALDTSQLLGLSDDIIKCFTKDILGHVPEDLERTQNITCETVIPLLEIQKKEPFLDVEKMEKPTPMETDSDLTMNQDVSSSEVPNLSLNTVSVSQKDRLPTPVQMYPLTALLPVFNNVPTAEVPKRSEIVTGNNPITTLSSATHVTRATNMTSSVLPVKVPENIIIPESESILPKIILSSSNTLSVSQDVQTTEPIQNTISSSTAINTSVLTQSTDINKIQNTRVEDLLSSLSPADKELFDSVVKTLSDTNPNMKNVNPIDVIMSLSSLNDISSLIDINN